MKVVYSPIQAAHQSLELDGAKLIPSWESPVRATLIADRLEPSHDFAEPEPLDRALVEQIHDPDYVDFLVTCWDRWRSEGNEGEAAMGFSWPAAGMRDIRPTSLDGLLGYYSFSADCSIGADTWAGVEASAASAQTAAGLVSDGLGVAFALCRPPGHHAGARRFGGYCYLNNAAIAAQRLRNNGVDRVAIVDIDYHHGNGTQSIFYQRSDVMFASIHADPRQEFPYFLGFDDEAGDGDGLGANLNIPLPWGTEADRWLQALDEALAWVTDHGPGALVVSVGVDTYAGDPISKFNLPTATFPVIGGRLADLGLPTVLVMEGGYATDALAKNVAALIDGFDSMD